MSLIAVMMMMIVMRRSTFAGSSSSSRRRGGRRHYWHFVGFLIYFVLFCFVACVCACVRECACTGRLMLEDPVWVWMRACNVDIITAICRIDFVGNGVDPANKDYLFSTRAVYGSGNNHKSNGHRRSQSNENRPICISDPYIVCQLLTSVAVLTAVRTLPTRFYTTASLSRCCLAMITANAM